jgi:ketopantoate reductase
MGKKMAVVGTGAAGSYIGAFLTREGHDLVLSDMWGEHVDKMNADGIVSFSRQKSSDITSSRTCSDHCHFLTHMFTSQFHSDISNSI